MVKSIDEEIISSNDDVMIMLDNLLEKRDSDWWDKFYENKEKPIPFFKNVPDENLVSYMEKGLIKRGRALDIGCGNGRNSLYLAEIGFDVLGLDFSKASIEWAEDLAKNSSGSVKFMCQSIFNFTGEAEKFDFIYDSGCFHHIKPHRREQYLRTILRHLKPEGYFGMVCFNLKGGADISDYDVYRYYSMQGGLGFSEYKLRTILEPYFDIFEFRQMKEEADSDVFGKDFLWTLLAKKKSQC